MNHFNARKNLGKWLKAKREHAGLTQAQVAELTGHHTSFVSRYESGQRLELMEFLKIVALLNAEPTEAIKVCFEDRSP